MVPEYLHNPTYLQVQDVVGKKIEIVNNSQHKIENDLIKYWRTLGYHIQIQTMFDCVEINYFLFFHILY